MNSEHKPKKLESRSWIMKWEGNKPLLKESHWMPGYTPAHGATPAEAVAHAMTEVLNETAKVRERWIQLNLLIEEQKNNVEKKIDSFGVEITETADMNEHIVDQEFADAPRLSHE